MIILRHVALLMLALVVIRVPSVADVSLAKPKWTVTLTGVPVNLNRNDRTWYFGVVGVTDSVIVMSEGQNMLAAISREDGKPLWRRVSKVNSLAKKDQPYYLDFWSVISSSSLGDPNELIALQHTWAAPPDTKRTSEGSEWEMLDARTGQILWRERHKSISASSDWYAAYEIRYGMLICVSEMDGDNLRFRDARTRQWLEPGSPQHQAMFDRAREAHHSSELLLVAGMPYLLNLSTGKTRHLPTGMIERYDGSSPTERSNFAIPLYERRPPRQSVFEFGEQVVSHVDTDDGRAGGLRDPKYLVGVNIRTGKLWTNGLDVSGGPIAPIEKKGVVAAWKSHSKTIHGIRVEDGKTIWKRKLAGQSINFAAGLEDTALFFATDEKLKTPKYIDVWQVEGLTGDAKKVARLPIGGLYVSGNDVFLTNGKRISAYSLKSLVDGLKK